MVTTVATPTIDRARVAAGDAIGTLERELVELSRYIHQHPEPAMRETLSGAACAVFLERHGFTVERGTVDLPTAFRAEAGTPGGPRIAFLAEYDALPGLGHGCGHNLIALANIAAGVGLRAGLAELGVPGQVVVFGTPAEEAISGKAFMAEAGAFDDIDAALGAHPGTPQATEPATTHGDSGRITAVTPDGEQSVFVDGLTSYVFGTEIVGASGVALDGDSLYVSIGGPGPQIADFPAADDGNSVVAIDLATGDVTSVANLGEYERENNPDPYAIDSNLGGIAVGIDGLVYVVDSGGNDIVTIDPETGELTLLAVVPGLPTRDGSGNPTRGDNPEVDPVRPASWPRPRAASTSVT